MYQWISHTWNPIGGQCPHYCEYCYVEDLKSKPVMLKKYTGLPFLVEKEMTTNLGKGNIIFVESCGDLFAEGVSEFIIMKVIKHCSKYPENTYLFQTKNPERMMQYTFPPNVIFGTTIESNRRYENTLAPRPYKRYIAMKSDFFKPYKKMISIEPIMDLDVDTMVRWIGDIKPSFVSIGANTKKIRLHEPSKEKVIQLINSLREPDLDLLEIKLKNNLDKIIGKHMLKLKRDKYQQSIG